MTLFLFMTGAAYFVLPYLSTPLLVFGVYKDRKNYMWYLLGLIINLSLIGYYYIPLISNDLFRHFIRIQNLRNVHITEVFSLQPLIVQNIWFYLVSITNNLSLLPFTAVFLTFYFTLKPLLRFGISEAIPSKKLMSFFLLILVWMHLIWPISGVRNSVSMALFFYGLYKEFVIKDTKKGAFILYALSALLHYSSFVLVAIRILLSVFKLISSKLIIITLLWGVFFEVIVNFISKINITYLNDVSNKAIAYSEFDRFSTFGLVNVGIKYIFCIVYVIAYYNLKKSDKILFYKYEKFYKFGLILALFCIGSFNNLLLVDRFGYLVLSFLPMLMMPIITKKNPLFSGIYIISYVPLLFLGIYIQLVYFRYAIFEISIIEFLTKDIIRLIFKI